VCDILQLFLYLSVWSPFVLSIATRDTCIIFLNDSISSSTSPPRAAEDIDTEFPTYVGLFVRRAIVFAMRVAKSTVCRSVYIGVLSGTAVRSRC
jgi:hypothetical protein